MGPKKKKTTKGKKKTTKGKKTTTKKKKTTTKGKKKKTTKGKKKQKTTKGKGKTKKTTKGKRKTKKTTKGKGKKWTPRGKSDKAVCKKAAKMGLKFKKKCTSLKRASVLAAIRGARKSNASRRASAKAT